MSTDAIEISADQMYATVQWELEQDEAGDACGLARYPDKTVQCAGSFEGGTVTIEGSMDGTNWDTLHGDGGVELVFSADGMAVIREAPLQIRPVASDTADLAVTVTIGAAMLR